MPIRWDKFTVKAQEAVQRANELASEHGNPELLPVHILAALVRIRKASSRLSWRRSESARKPCSTISIGNSNACRRFQAEPRSLASLRLQISYWSERLKKQTT